MRVPALESAGTAPEPLPGSPLDVVVDGGWRLPVRCREAAAPGDVHLRPVGRMAVMPGGATACDASLEWRSARGLVRRTGVLRPGADDFILTEATDAVVMQRRNFARVRVAVRVRVGPEDGGDLLTQTVDLSVGGMLAEAAAILAIGDLVRFQLDLPGGTPLQGSGSVVRATPYGHRAIEFDPMTHAEEQRLARYVMEQEREGRSAAAYGGS